MIIVGQDKEMIINFNNIVFIEIENVDNKYELYSESSNMRMLLGTYKTFSRAKEVLQSIIIAKNSDSKIYEMPEE